MTERGIRIRPMAAADMDAVMALAAALPHAPHWPRATYARIFMPGAVPRRIALVAEEGTAAMLAGFAVASLTPPEAELESIAVAPACQRRGLARGLFGALAAELRIAGVTEVVLEVRPSNGPARALYAALRFAEAGRRTGYYADPHEDALVLRRALAGPEM
ncbi:MAG TPA: GNAT family N-acetyltransferase [Terracidiphilus sp.]|nr:GNAT family N-acetyltransferase [Terracidiphilus sp.]